MLWQGWRFREALVLYLSKFKLLKTLPFTEVGMPSKLFQNPLAIYTFLNIPAQMELKNSTRTF